MVEGTCHCGSVRWTFAGVPESVTACNCTLCRRYGGLWAYDYENEGVITFSGPTETYARGRHIAFHFCSRCACVAYWRAFEIEDGRRRVAVNLRLAVDPAVIAALPIDHFDGLESWEDLPRDGRCVADMWF